MKVLHVITGLEPGGAETQLELLLPLSRHDSEVCALYNADGAVGRRLSEAGFVVHDLRMRSNFEVGKVRELARLMRRRGYDAVHLHLYRAILYGRIAARLAGVPVVVTTEHSLGETQIEGRAKGGPVRLLYLATEPLSDVTVAVSPAVGQRLARYGVRPRKILRVPNGLDFARYEAAARREDPDAAARRELGLPEEAFVVGSVGRLHEGKRLDLLVEAFASAFASGFSEAFAPCSSRVGPPAYLVLVGDGPERERLEDLARGLGVADRVVFAGARGDVARALGAIDLFVSLSREETFGISVMEAVAAGRRVFADACPALDALGPEEAARTGVRRMAREAEAPDGEDYGEELSRVREALLEARWGEYPRARLTERARAAYGAAEVAGRLDDVREGLLASRSKRAGEATPPATRRRNGEAAVEIGKEAGRSTA